MARTLLSILTNEPWLEDKVRTVINSTNYSLGYSGNKEREFITYLKTQTYANHILFVKPVQQYQHAYSEADLSAYASINIIIIGPPLTNELIGLIQMSSISGYITNLDINSSVFNDIIGQVYLKRYFANEQIPEEFWQNNPKPPERLPKPNFTKRQKEVLYWLCHGFTQCDIAQIMETSVSNVENHLNRLKSKIYVKSTNEVVVVAIHNAWVIISKDRFKRHTPFS
jgi:DNA-binding NarL/FixJ family response regulator